MLWSITVCKVLTNCMDFSLMTVAVIWTYLDKALNVMYNTNKNRKIF